MTGNMTHTTMHISPTIAVPRLFRRTGT